MFRKVQNKAPSQFERRRSKATLSIKSVKATQLLSLSGQPTSRIRWWIWDLIGSVTLSLILLMLNCSVKERKSRVRKKRVTREKFVEIDPKKVHFSHRRHQSLIKEIDETCEICHHKRKKGQDPKACRRCHFEQKTISKGKYARKGQKLNLKDISHLLCDDCHQKMLQEGYRGADGSPGMIPTKCHHCHEIKKK